MARMSSGPGPRLALFAGIALAVFVSVLVAPVSPVAAATSSANPAQAGAGWLARQLVDGERLETVFGDTAFADQGLTADAVLSFDAAHVAQTAAGKATAWLAQPEIVASYVGNGTTEAYAGAHAKLALVAQAQGIDPTSFGGVDLVARLAGLLAPSGRYSDRSEFGDFSNAIGQSLAVIALERRPGGAPAAATAFLASSQCSDGGFPVQFEAAPCTSSVDATGFATQAMLASGRAAEAVNALDFLVAAQELSGGFADGGTENANSTGLALQAMRAGGRAGDLAAVNRADAFLRNLQVGCAGLEERRGAVAFDAGGFVAGTANRATAQAVLGLAGIGLVDIDNQGAAADAPVLSCGLSSTATTRVTPSTLGPNTSTPNTPAATKVAPTTTPTTPTSPGLVPLAIAAGTGTGATATTATTVSPPAVASRPLARTGSPTSPLAAAAAAFLILGAAALVGGRQPERRRRVISGGDPPG